MAHRFRIERQLGSGGMAVVYLATDLKGQRQVALKVLRRELALVVGPERFLREISITSSLQHPGILPLLESGETQGFLFYAMPYVAGATLRDLLDRKGPLPAAQAVAIAADVAEALDYAHAQGVVHRDIKPENVLLSSGRAMVADFGIARAVVVAGGPQFTTSAGVPIGTPPYMSPEQAAGAADLDGRSDIYSLACVLFEMLAGEPPFTGPSPQAVMARHVSERTPSLAILRPALPAALVAVIETGLAKAPADRYQSAAEFAAALRRALTDTRQAWTRSRLRRTLIAGGGVVLVAAGAIALAWRSAPGPRQPAAPDPTHVAVLYLEDRSSDGSLGHLAAGLTEDLIAELSEVPALHVISPDGVRPYRGAPAALDSVARHLSVGTVIAGSLEDTPNGLRLAVRLVDAATGRQLAGQTLEQRRADVVLLRDELVSDVARQLRIRLGSAIALRTRRAGTRNARAWELVRLAEAVRAEAESTADAAASGPLLLRADSLLEQAEAMDRSWVEPIVLRGWVAYRMSGLHMTGSPSLGAAAGRTSDQWLREGLRYAGRALAQAPGDPQALELRGTVYYRVSFLTRSGAFDDLPDALGRAETDLRAASASPSPIQTRALGTLSYALSMQAKWDEAYQAAHRAYTVDAYFRDADDILNSLYYTSWELGRAAEARQWCERGRRSFPAHWGFRYCELANMVAFPGATATISAAWHVADSMLALAPEARGWLEPRAQAMVAAVIAHRGLGDSAQRVLRHARALSPRDTDILFFDAYVQLILGRRQDAVRLVLELLAAEPSERLRLRRGWLLRELRDEPVLNE